MSGSGYGQAASTDSGFGQMGSMLQSGYARLGAMGLQNSQPSNQYSAFGGSPFGSYGGQPVRAGQAYGGFSGFQRQSSPFMGYQAPTAQQMPPMPAYQASVPSFGAIMQQQQQAQAAQAAAAPQDAYYGPGAGG